MFDALTELEIAVDKVGADESPLDVVRMCRLADRVEFLRVRAIGSFDRSLVWQAEGFLSAASAVRARTRMTRGQAHRAIELARKVEQLPELAGAFGAGEISRAHVEQIADGCTPARAAMMQGIDRELVDYARIADPRELRGAVRRMTDAFDGDGGASTDQVEHDKNTVTLSTVAGRGVLNGDLDLESTEIVATAFDAEIAARRRDDEDRPLTRRRAEALVSMCRLYLAARADGTGGRATRTVGPALWNALVARDRHCTEPGCTRGPADCEAHHIVHWSKGGPTNLDNLKLLCWEHHRQQHIRDALRGREGMPPLRHGAHTCHCEHPHQPPTIHDRAPPPVIHRE